MHKTRTAIDKQQKEQQYKTIVFIGPNGKETWLGTITGLKNMYPYARIIKIS